MYDIVICSLPPFPANEILAAPAILKACVEQHGYTAKTIDLSQQLYINFANRSAEKHATLSNALYPFILHKNISERQVIDQFIAESAQKILDFSPSYIGLSVFSSFTHKSTYLLCSKLKELDPTVKIVLGGRGVDVPVTQVKVDLELKKSINDMFTPFYRYLIDNQLADYYIIGDGEEAIVELLEGTLNQTNGSRQVADIYTVPTPNFDDYQLNEYAGSIPSIPITGSKGCVRACEFCDVAKQFGRYRYRTGRDVANEIIELHNKYHISEFFLNDSLVNGSLSAFVEFLEVLSAYNNQHTDQISWNGQYITRPAGQTPIRVYELLKSSGAHDLIIGAESGSNAVLKTINKKTTVEDLFDELALFSKYGINCRLNIISGYWSETWDNFLETVKMFKDLYPYVMDGTVISMAIGFPLVLYDRTPLYDKRAEYGIHLGPTANDAAHSWYSDLNPRLTLKERYYRKLILEKVAIALQYPIGDLTESHDWIVKYLNTNTDKVNEFQKTILPNS